MRDVIAYNIKYCTLIVNSQGFIIFLASFSCVFFWPPQQAGSKKATGPSMLVLAPTRELALQSAEVIAEAGKHCDISSVCVYGGVPKREQRIALGGGRGGGGCVQVVVATPGRLKDLVGEGVCDLSHVSCSIWNVWSTCLPHMMAWSTCRVPLDSSMLQIRQQYLLMPI